jgi:pilus assembly protein FimV
VYALSLGNLELRSALHQPLDARVPILSATGDEIDSLRVKIASPEEFARAGVEYRAVLTQAKFEIQQTSKGPDYIRITSHDPVREPFLNFLLEVNWSKGRLIREFTVLLDPPLYDPSRRISWEPARVQPVAPAAAPAPTSGGELQIAKTPSAAPMPAPAAMPAPSPAPVAAPIAAAPPASDGTYNTLWSAATAMRPDNSVSIQQMMLALLRTNPDAFIRGNINLLKKGYVLKMPERGAMDGVSRAEALAEVQRHHALWREYRERGAASAPRQPEGAATVAATPGDTSGGTAVQSQDEANLRLLAGNETGAAAGKGADGDLALAKESLESKARENEELRAQLKESEEIIEKLKSRVSLQDEQLAELQSKLGEGSAEPAATTPTAEAPETIAEPSAPLELNPESWRSLDNVVQTPTYPLPEPTPAATEEMPAAEEPPAEAPAEATPEVEAPPTEAVAETPPEEPAPMVEEAPPATAEVEAPAEPAPEEVPPEATAEAPPEEPAPDEPTPPGGGFFDKLNNLFGTVVPKSLLEGVPGGAATLLGALVVVIGGLVALLARRRAAPAPESFPTTAEEGENAFDLALGGAQAAREQTLDENAFAPATADEDELFAATSHTEPVAMQPGAEPEFEREAAADEDPLAEVNVYLAYERFDEAERLIREAIATNPGESKYRLRLLEVYYSSNDRTKYEAAARELRDAVGGQGPLWDSAVAMWREMSPNRELFAGGEEPVVPAAAAREQRQFVDITAVEDMASRTVTTLAPAAATAGEAAAASTSAELGEAGETPSVFDVASADQDFDLLDITASGDVREADSDILDISAGVGTGTGEMAFSEPASIEGASSAVNELLSLTKSNAVTPSQPSEGDFLESSLDFDPGLAGTSGSPENPEATVGPDHLLDFDLGTDTSSVVKAPENNIVDFPARAESVEPTPDSLTTMIDVAPPAATPAEAPIEFDIGGLDLALDAESTAGTKGGEASLDLALESPGAAEVTMGDIDSLSLDEDTVRLFENDLASTSAQDTMPMFEPDSDMTATGDRSKGGGFGKPATGEDELTLDNDDLTLDDITKSLEETVGSKARTYSEFETVDLTLDAKALMDNEQTAELFEQELKHDGADDGFGPAAATLGTQGSDDVDTKLNLAKAYIELGDAAGARTILDEVTGEGSETQREEAQRLLRELTT